MKSILASFCFLFSIALLWSDLAANYSFTSETHAYEEISGGYPLGTTWTYYERFVDPAYLTGGSDNDGPGFPLGFNFVFNEEIFDRIAIDSRGWISFGQSALTPSVNIFCFNAYYPLMAPNNIVPALLMNRAAVLACQLQAQAGASLRMQTIGNAPNRTCIVQWKNYRRYGPHGVGDSLNFQIRMYETSNQIEFRYGEFNISNEFQTICQVGLRGPDPSDFISRTNTTSWEITVPGENNIDTCNLGAAVYPPNGLSFVYITSPVCLNDLQVRSIVGNLTPSIGQPSGFIATIRNRGSSPQMAYQLQLMSGSTELVSVNCGTLQAFCEVDIPVTWVPSIVGETSVLARVVLAGDQNESNNDSPPILLHILSSDTLQVTIGDGSELARLPMDFHWRSSLVETVFTEEEIFTTGLITQISFDNEFTTNLLNKPTRIWLGSTTWNNMSGGWISPNNLTLVYDGNVDYPSGQNVIAINLQQPFNYTGNNLVLMVYRPLEAMYYSINNNFKCQTRGMNRSRILYSDSMISPTNPSLFDSDLRGQYPRTVFRFSTSGNNPNINIIPSGHDFGQVVLNSTHAQTFNLANISEAPAQITSVSLTGDSSYTLLNVPILPITLNSGQNLDFTVRYLPLTSGTQTAIVAVTTNVFPEPLYIPLSGSAINPVIVTLPYTQGFDEIAYPGFPLDWTACVESDEISPLVVAAGNTFHSPPYSIVLYNSMDISAQLMLVSPRLGNNVDLNSITVSVWIQAEAGDGDCPLQVGVVTDPDNPVTFTEVTTIVANATWTQHQISLQSYTGCGRYIAFKHGLGDLYRTIYVDDVLIEGSLPNNDDCIYEGAGKLLLCNSPNPFMHSTTIKYSIKFKGVTAASIYNIKSQKIKSFRPELQDKGNHTLLWDGLDELGKACKSGIYLIKLTQNGKDITSGKMTLLK